jgi:hypothetical protein
MIIDRHEQQEMLKTWGWVILVSTENLETRIRNVVRC